MSLADAAGFDGIGQTAPLTLGENKTNIGLRDVKFARPRAAIRLVPESLRH
jgi:hypothetical protein